MITSDSNPKIKFLKSLTIPKYRKKEQLFLVDDIKIIEEGLKAGHIPEAVFVSRFFKQLTPFHPIEVSESILSSISDLSSFSGVIAVFPIPFTSDDMVIHAKSIILLDGVQDPVNVGTILRSSALFGVEGAILVTPCADPYSLKAIRAGKGSIFHIPIIRKKNDTVPSFPRKTTVYSAVPSGGTSLYEEKIHYPYVLAMGGEGHGMSEKTATLCTRSITIPNSGSIDSMNVGSAASTILSWFFFKLGNN